VAAPVALALLAVAGCSTTVSGSGSFDTAAGPTGSGTASPSPTGSGTASPTPTGSGSGTEGRQTLACAGGKVLRPANAPYCYLLPAGFKDVSGLTSTTVGQSGEHPSSVAVSTDTISAGIRDLIILLDFTLKIDSDELSDDTLVRQLAVLITQFESQGFTFTTKTPERLTVDGARAFVYHARANQGYFSDLVFAFRGTQEVELNCQYKLRQAQIQQGCQQILGSLQIKG
jgi:hypothetical protein